MTPQTHRRVQSVQTVKEELFGFENQHFGNVSVEYTSDTLCWWNTDVFHAFETATKNSSYLINLMQNSSALKSP